MAEAPIARVAARRAQLADEPLDPNQMFDGGRVEVEPGDVVAIAAGTETVWTVHETLLKGYALFGGP